MRINPDDLRRHYASLPDGALLALDRNELTDLAKMIYDEEAAKRGLTGGQEYPVELDHGADEMQGVEEVTGVETEDEPDWMDEAACACSFTVRSRQPSDAAADACSVLKAARIPCHLSITQEEPPKAETGPWYAHRLMVPHGMALHAISVLDHDLFNEEQEAEWRSSFEMLSDEELSAIDPEVLCSGLLDRVARLRRAYADEMARRNLLKGRRG